MSDPFSKNSYNEQLTRVYVALAMAQDAARRWVDEKPEYEPLKGLVTTLEVTAQMLEEILEEALPEKPSTTSTDVSCPELIM
jgi:hypothetical protein